MVVLLKQACIIQRSEKIADVLPFLHECLKMEKVLIVDDALAYDFKFTTKTYLLITMNAL